MVSLLGGVEFLENKRNVATVVTSSEAGNVTHGREPWRVLSGDLRSALAGGTSIPIPRVCKIREFLQPWELQEAVSI